ncbi:MAG TPA: PQQ-dependent sugar dehydrogenase [Solimonas sp.]|nr:PQQ-dependent sugar dehydrogenase [Solimonas sp.]
MLGAPSSAVLTIRDNEPPAPGQLQFTATEWTAAEGDGALRVRLDRLGGSDGEVSVGVSTTDGSARAGSDYTAISARLSWAAGDVAPRFVEIPVIDNTRLDGDRSFGLLLSGPTGGATLGAQASATALIQDDELAHPGTLQFQPALLGAAEGAGAVAVTVMRSGGSDGAVGVTWSSSDGSARAGSDYRAGSGTLNWASGDSGPQSFNLELLDDAVRESAETVILTLTAPTGGAVLGPASSATLSIADDEPPDRGSVQFSVSALSLDETASLATLTVTRSGASAGAVSVSYASGGGSALAGADYGAVSGQLAWGDGDATPRSFTVPLQDDLRDEPDESLVVTLSSPTPGATLGPRSRATLTLRDDDPALALVNAFPSLSFSQPVFMTAAPGDSGRLYVVEQSGVIRVFANQPGAVAAPVFLDLRDRVFASGEAGLLGLAFDPGFAANGLFYVFYTPAAPNRTRVSRFHASSRDAAEPASEQIVLSVDRRNSYHNGGWLGFGADGKLYATLGDDGDSGNAQRLDTPLGKVLRLEPGGAAPADNPFTATANARPEIWAFGFRNPWRASFDRQTGELWLGDVGESTREEIDLVVRAGNYGWSVCEGTLCATPAPPAHQPPVHDYGRTDGGTVTGGYVYRGSAIPAARGIYFFADFSAGTVWALRRDAGGVLRDAIGDVDLPSALAEDAAGEIYVLSYGGVVYRIAPP